MGRPRGRAARRLDDQLDVDPGRARAHVRDCHPARRRVDPDRGKDGVAPRVTATGALHCEPSADVETKTALSRDAPGDAQSCHAAHTRAARSTSAEGREKARKSGIRASAVDCGDANRRPPGRAAVGGTGGGDREPRLAGDRRRRARRSAGSPGTRRLPASRRCSRAVTSGGHRPSTRSRRACRGRQSGCRRGSSGRRTARTACCRRRASSCRTRRPRAARSSSAAITVLQWRAVRRSG